MQKPLDFFSTTISHHCNLVSTVTIKTIKTLPVCKMDVQYCEYAGFEPGRAIAPIPQ